MTVDIELTSGGVTVSGKVTDKIVYLDASEEEKSTSAQAKEPVDEKTGKFLHDQVLCRSKEGEAVMAAPKEIEYMDVSPAQIVSVATALIPFLEHNDANRALMGANMQRQAVPLMITEPPLVGTGLEYRAAVDTGDVVQVDGDVRTDERAEPIDLHGQGVRAGLHGGETECAGRIVDTEPGFDVLVGNNQHHQNT